MDKVFEKLVDRIETVDPNRSLPFPEQDILNDYYQERWQTLPYTYNALKQLSLGHSRTWNLNDIKNIHYTLKKPWEVKSGEVDDYEELNKIWWATYSTSRSNKG